MRKKILNYFLISSIIAISGCGKSPQQERPPVPVVSATAIMQDVEEYVEAIGCCKAQACVDVISQVAGTVKSVNFNQGDSIKKGDLLYAIDQRKYEATFNQAKAKLTQAEAQLRVDIAQFERSKSLLPQNFISMQEYESIESKVIQSQAAVEAAKAALEQAKLNLDYCHITATIDGIAGKYQIDVGETLSDMALSSTILVNIRNVDELYIDFAVSENIFPTLYKSFCSSENGLNVEVKLVSDSAICGAAKLQFLDNCIDKRTGSINLRATLHNIDHKFWPGEAVTVKVLLKTNKNSILVPNESVKLGQNGRYLFVIKGDKTADLRIVKIGQQYGDFIVIKEGVQAGENVVKTGQLMLAPGSKVVEIPDQRQNKFQSNLKFDKEMAEQNPTTK